MSSSATKKKTKIINNIITVLVGSLLMGMLWRIRGTHGWGSVFGMLNAGYVFSLFIIAYLGGRRKLGLGWLFITSVSLMVTTPEWGSIIHQICGVLDGSTYDENIYVSLFSAIVLLLCLGFGMAVFFGIMLGRAYSDKQWKLKDFVVILAIYFAVNILSRVSVSLIILNLIQPEAQSLFKDGLYEIGNQDPGWKVYLQHCIGGFGLKDITGGRNYFASVKAISSALSAVAAIFATRHIVKDNRAANVGVVTCFAFAFAVIAADLFLFFGSGGWHYSQGFVLPDNIAPWPMWEYATGFIAGGIITAVMINLKNKTDVDDPFVLGVSPEVKETLTFIFGYCVLVGVNVVRPVFQRYDNSIYQILHTVAASLIAVAIIIVTVSICGVSAQKVNMKFYASFMIIVSVSYLTIVYIFVGDAEYSCYLSMGYIHNTLVAISSAVVIVWGIINFIGAYKTRHKLGS